MSVSTADELDSMLATHARITFPYDKQWKRKAAEYCAEHLYDIRVFRALGLQAIPDMGRRKLVEDHLGPQGKHDHADYGFNVWLLNECIGERPMSPDHIFFRCRDCTRIRTSRAMEQGKACVCGSGTVNNRVGPLETQKILGLLVMGR